MSRMSELSIRLVDTMRTLNDGTASATQNEVRLMMVQACASEIQRTLRVAPTHAYDIAEGFVNEEMEYVIL